MDEFNSLDQASGTAHHCWWLLVFHFLIEMFLVEHQWETKEKGGGMMNAL